MRKVHKIIVSCAIGLTMLLTPIISYADDNATNTVASLTLSDATRMALAHDETIKKASAEIDRTKSLRDNAQDAVQFTPAPGNVYGPQIEVTWTGLLKADLAYRSSLKNYDAKIDTVELDVCKKYWDVQVAQEKLDVQDKLKQQALVNLQNARAGVASGAVAQSTLTLAEAQYNQALNNYNLAQHALDDAYTAFNQVVGLDPSARPQLTDEVSFEPLQVASLDTAVSQVLEEAPNVWKAQQDIDLKQWAFNMMYSSGTYTPYDAREKELEEAKIDYETVKEAMAQATRDIYYKIKQLEEGYNVALEAQKMAQEKLRVANANYSAGTGVKADVVAAEVALSQANEALDELVRQHAYLKLSFEKPWAVSSTSSSSSSTSSSSN
ncbi:TolC family protein [Thermoanaerobacterium thermosaccharolyticum]|uniref:TolC family protein n=1 Tax=Thermoanaerobacterium thermosaccharolyticum TaxID=1517 RepID=UPI00123A292E|nr:TolC family protein [Thermoanaerobacterium thermosaccharolyticum]KAA5805992.1 TolC family protein [Thermoanaerobacterium thermosaccharolyticum]